MPHTDRSLAECICPKSHRAIQLPAFSFHSNKHGTTTSRWEMCSKSRQNLLCFFAPNPEKLDKELRANPAQLSTQGEGHCHSQPVLRELICWKAAVFLSEEFLYFFQSTGRWLRTQSRAKPWHGHFLAMDLDTVPSCFGASVPLVTDWREAQYPRQHTWHTVLFTQLRKCWWLSLRPRHIKVFPTVSCAVPSLFRFVPVPIIERTSFHCCFKI